MNLCLAEVENFKGFIVHSSCYDKASVAKDRMRDLLVVDVDITFIVVAATTITGSMVDQFAVLLFMVESFWEAQRLKSLSSINLHLLLMLVEQKMLMS